MRAILFLLVAWVGGQPTPTFVTANAARRPVIRMAANAGKGWRCVYYQGRWWYWMPSERWAYFDGSRWLQLDLLNQVAHSRRNASQEKRLAQRSGRGGAAFRFGELAVPRSRAGAFGAAGVGVPDRTFAGAMGRDAYLLIPGDFSPAMRSTPPAPYGPDSAYGSYGRTNPFLGGLHAGGGGNYGYGLGSPNSTTADADNGALPNIGGTPLGPLPGGGH
jgi:hypothetical protein